MTNTPQGDDEVVGPTNRSFGLVFTIVFLVAGLWPLWSGGEPRLWAVGVAAVVLALAVGYPRALAIPNRLWLALGLALHRVVNPIVMGLVFYVVVTPFGLVMRFVRRDVARGLRPDRTAPTYWVARQEGASRMDQQF